MRSHRPYDRSAKFWFRVERVMAMLSRLTYSCFVWLTRFPRSEKSHDTPALLQFEHSGS